MVSLSAPLSAWLSPAWLSIVTLSHAWCCFSVTFAAGHCTFSGHFYGIKSCYPVFLFFSTTVMQSAYTCHNFGTYAGFEFFSLCTTFTSPLSFHSPMSCALTSGDPCGHLVCHPSCQELRQNWWGDAALGLTHVASLLYLLHEMYYIWLPKTYTASTMITKGLMCQTALQFNF